MNYKFQFSNKIYSVLGFQTPKNQIVSDKSNDIKPFEKTHLKRDCIGGSILNGTRQPILFSFKLVKTFGFQNIF